MSAPTLLILAAGMGSRYSGSKIAEPVGPNGETIADYSVYDALAAGFERVVVVVRREIEAQAREWAQAHFGRRIRPEFILQDPNRIPFGYRVPAGRQRPWGTTHALLCAASALRTPFAVINVGDFYGAQTLKTMAQHLNSGSADFAVMGYLLRNTLSDFGSVPRGLCTVDANGMLARIVELKNIEKAGGHASFTGADGAEQRLTGDEIVSMNLWGFTPAVIPGLAERFEAFLKAHAEDQNAECVLATAVNELLELGQARVRVLRTHDSWFGVTYREDHSQAEGHIRRLIEAGHYPKKLW